MRTRSGFLLSLGAAAGFWATAALAADEPVVDLRGAAAPAAPGAPYAARTLPDRIVLSPGADPAREMQVSWRTDRAAAASRAELVELVPAPGFGQRAVTVTGTSIAAISENGEARYHKARFTGLKPDTAYAYRVQGSAGFSEWHQFRTAKPGPAPFTLIYMGDTQNRILDVGSLVWRRALLQTANPALMLHAGDLVASRDDMIHDDEWGEWAASGGWALASVPQVPAAGNHEHIERTHADGSEHYQLGAHFPLMFALPGNGAPGAEATTYFTDYQGVRIVVLDGTSALELGTLAAQTAWLDKVLAGAGKGWKVVLFHQPVFTCARPRDTEVLKQAWKPVFERHGVDLVLQGHDHCYGRWTSEKGSAAAREARAGGAAQGPVYLVSVAGAKMYALNDRATWQPDRAAEDTSLFQTLEFTPGRMVLKAYLNTGVLYDGFALVKTAKGRNRFTELPDKLATLRRCRDVTRAGADPQAPRRREGPDGLACAASLKD